MLISSCGVVGYLEDGIPDRQVIKGVLNEEMEDASPFETLEILVTFKGDSILPEDIAAVKAQGLLVKRQFHVVPTIFTVATVDAINRLSNYERISNIIFNEKLEYKMDESTNFINASMVWNMRIKDTLGNERPPVDGSSMLIDGMEKPITVVVVDSGIDAGHPDLTYGSKTIANYKSDTDLVYIGDSNTDTSSGHGTHCAGTIAGSGAASDGARRGVAPGAQLIGISTGDGPAILNALGGLEWTYDHSRPNNNPDNIRVVSNSWGSSGEHNPDGPIMQVIRKLTYENNVVVVFASGNAGSENHEGTEVTTNPYSLEPSAIGVAATWRDEEKITYFSSRGIADDKFTWPDVGAPGYHIESTQARGTFITAQVAWGDIVESFTEDAYYMAISGTSMATPHISGVAALLWEAAPSMRTSKVNGDFQSPEDMDPWETVWEAGNGTLIHEAELIMKLTATYILPDDKPFTDENDNGIPEQNSNGSAGGLPHDYVQGYGRVRVLEAVALALTLEELRRDNPEASVFDAWETYTGLPQPVTRSKATNTLVTDWKGAVSNLNVEEGGVRDRAAFESFPHYMYVPENTSQVILTLDYAPLGPDGIQYNNIYLSADFNEDGSIDWEATPIANPIGNRGVSVSTIEVSAGDAGKLWTFFTNGILLSLSGARIYDPNDKGIDDYPEVFVRFWVSAQLIFDMGPDDTISVNFIDYHAAISQLRFGEPAAGYAGGTIELASHEFDLSYANPKAIPDKKIVEDGIPWWSLGLALALVLVVLAYVYKKRQDSKAQLTGIPPSDPIDSKVSDASGEAVE